MPSFSFFQWMGGKSTLARRICQLLPAHRCYVELFAGAANILFAKPRSRAEVINDVDGDLVNLFRVVKYHHREFLREMTLLTHSRREFQDLLAQRGLTDIQRAARTWAILRMAFGGMGLSNCPTFGYKTQGRSALSRSTLGQVRRCHKRLDGVHVEQLDFADCIRRYDRPETLFYCDPPYWQTEQYRSPFTWDDQLRLAEALQSIQGRFLLSINDHPDIRTLYKPCRIRQVDVRYTLSRTKTDNAQKRKELLIANYPLKKP